MERRDWTDEENDAIVADYFAMLVDDLSDRPYNKAEHNRALRQATGRPRGSIEYKHQNISAVLLGIGEDWIPGYKPAFNYQTALEDAVSRWLQRNRDWAERIGGAGRHTGFETEGELWIGPPPTRRNTPAEVDVERAMGIAGRFNVAERDERNRALGRAGEERVLLHERANLIRSGRRDLAERIRWVSEEDGDGAGYDIASYEPDGRERLIEVKTTNGWERTPFHISRNELDVAGARRDVWCLMRLYRFRRDPKAFEIRPPLKDHVALTPTSFRAHII